MDTYQAIYDAVRSRISNGDIGSAVSDVVRQCFDFSYIGALVQQEVTCVGYQMTRPFTVLRPKIYPDGNQWCALYGDNLQDGVCGFGDTPEAAAAAFDKAWNSQTLGQKPEAVETNDKEDHYLMGSCTEAECQLCRTPKFARKPGMHHSGLTAWDKP